MKTLALLSLIILSGITACSPASTKSEKQWHESTGRDHEPISLPSCDLERVQKLRTGDNLDDVERIVGNPAIHYYSGADFAILHTSDPGEKGFYWEVALRHGSDRRITDISYKRIPFE